MDVAVLLLGLVAGRLFNEVIDHLPLRRPVFGTPVACPQCSRSVGALWVPVLGYLGVRGRCPHCGGRLSPRLPVVEALSALLFWYAYRRTGLTLETLFAWALVSLTVMVSAIDLGHRLIPNKLVIAGLVLALPLSILAGRPITSTLLGGAAAFALLLVIGAVYPGAMGGGDIKLSLALGLFLGFPNSLVGLVFGFVAGGLVGLVLILSRMRKLKDMIPFGPFLAGGALAAFWWGAQVLGWYLPFLGGH